MIAFDNAQAGDSSHLLEVIGEPTEVGRFGAPSGRGYAERTEAYLGWTIAAASLLKQHSKARQAEIERQGEE